ncbi:polysaccharide deacetylase family protein [Pseudarthrobacter sp. P1]|uniref:polysaccharide deacetylase family protein n=1 Tax=Pseudarthrobacter sp. P1 TaxID=3418418 RepID=UPI003CF765BD
MGAAALLLATLFNTAVLAPPARAAGPATVTLTFDDGNADQVAAAQYMNSKGLKGTFFTPSGYLNAPQYMTTAQALALQTAGNEIAGHTVTHPDLAQMGADEIKRQICNDRVNLANMGFRVTNFAYPFASSTAAVQQTVAACGYNSARGLGDLKSKAAPTLTDLAEPLPVPAADLMFTKAPDEVDNTWSLADMQAVVTQAEPAGGWVQLTFHHFDSTTDPLTVTTANFRAYVDWLVAEQTAGRVIVKTVRQVMAAQFPDPANAALDVNKPLVNGPAAPAPITTGNLIKNPGLETAGPVATGLPQCFAIGSFGSNTHAFSTVTPGHTGAAAEQMVMSVYKDGDAKLLPTLDLGECAPSAIPGHTYTMMAWYKTTAITQFELYYRTGLGTWTYWTAGPQYVPATAWTQATWTSPPVPAGASAISIGMNLVSTGTLTTDDYELYDTVSLPSATVTAAITAKAAATPSLGASTGSVIYPLANGGGSQTFQNGAVYWSPATGAHTITGGIRQTWGVYQSEAGRMGYPATDEVGGLRSGGVYQMFQGGAIIWSPATGSHISVGANRQTWSRFGFENGQLGYPTTDEIAGTAGGVYQLYQGGTITWSPASGSHAVMGGIGATWRVQGSQNGQLRYPTSDEAAGLVRGGYVQYFQGGAIYWTPATGSHISQGAIRFAWAGTGYENGRLGYPTTNEYPLAGGAVGQDYQGGRIIWTPGTGTTIQYAR